MKLTEEDKDKVNDVLQLFQTEHTMFPDPANQEWITWIKQNLTGKNLG